MNTKEFLHILSKGAIDYSQSTHKSLLERRAEYLDQYNRTDAAILAKQRSGESNLPFLNTLKNKVASIVSAPNEELPVVTRYDLHSGIRHIAERAPRDLGLRHLSAQLEQMWHQDPMGSFTYGQVSGLVKAFRDNFPRSTAPDAIEAECARVGMHKLPVAKLARVASKISSQKDYDDVVRANGLDGDRIEQIRSRTFIRSMVAMRASSADAVVADKLMKMNASLDKSADHQFLMKQLDDAVALSETIAKALADGSQEAFQNNLEDIGQQIQDLDAQLDKWIAGLDMVRNNASVPEEEGHEKVRVNPAPVKQGPQQEQEPDKSWEGPEFRERTPEEQDIEDAGLNKKRKLLDPRTWFASKGAETIRLAKSAAVTADLFEDTATVESLLKFSNILASITGQLAPLAPSNRPAQSDDLDLAGDDILPEGPGVDNIGIPGGMPNQEAPGDGQVDQPEFDMGVNVLEEIEDAADEIVQDAPPEAMDYIDHEMQEGHTAPPGTAEWGAEEILNEGHEFPPPSEGWIEEEEGELGLQPGGLGDAMRPPAGPGAVHSDVEMTADAPPGMEDTAMKLKKEYPGEPEKAFATAWSIYNKNKKGEKADKEEGAGKGIPLPRGKVKTQPKVTTYGKACGMDGGATLKAADVEAKLLDGKKLIAGGISIHINKDDEVEIWDKEAGRACDLMDLDIAISDWMHMAGLVKESQVDDKQAQTGGRAYSLEIQYPKGNSFQETNQARSSFIKAIEQLVPSMKIDDESSGRISATVWGTDDATVTKAIQKLSQMGGKVNTSRVAQASPPAPAAPSAPAGAPPGAGAPPASDGLSTPLSEIISAGMTHYKQMGMSYGAAVSQLRKDYKEREAEIDSPEGGMLLLSIGTQLWTGGAGGAPAAAPSAEPAMPPSQPVMPMAAAAKDAQSKMKEPSIRKPKDHVSVPKDLGPDSETKGAIPSPGTIKSQPNKGNHGKMSPKSLGKDSEGEDLLPSPGKPGATHDPKSQPGTKLPDKKLDPDSEPNVPFKNPGLKSTPSVKK